MKPRASFALRLLRFGLFDDLGFRNFGFFRFDLLFGLRGLGRLSCLSLSSS